MKTSLGIEIQKKSDRWEICLTDLRVFRGLSILSKNIGELVLEQVDTSPGDINVLYRINPEVNPELVQMQLAYVQVYARSGILRDLVQYREEFHYQLRTVFGTFQRPSWGAIIHPEFYHNGEDTAVEPSRALLFPFHHTSLREEVDYRFILERVASRLIDGGYFLRLTVECHDRENLSLNSLAFREVDDLKSRLYIAGSTRISESLNEKIRMSCQRGLHSYHEQFDSLNPLFEQLAKSYIGRLKSIHFFWNKSFSQTILDGKPHHNISILKKLLLVLEDKETCQLLKQGETIRVVLLQTYVNIYLSQLNRVLNFAINTPRQTTDPQFYLNRMPELAALARQEDHNLDFANIRVFLIHHITSEILAMIQFLRLLAVDFLNAFFVKYSGVVADDYLQTLLDIPEEQAFFAGLTRVEKEGGGDYYILADYYSENHAFQPLNEILCQQKLDYFAAMRLACGHFFLRFCQQAQAAGKQVLLIEDGGYVAPFINELALSGKITREVMAEFYISGNFTESNFSDWLAATTIGTIEHTRNGYDRLKAVEETFQGLQIPAFSIAISQAKTVDESREVAHSILHAIESVLHSQGKVLSRRRPIVLGAGGNIGRFLCQYLQQGRIGVANQPPIAVDTIFSVDHDKYRYSTLEQIPAEVLGQVDLWIGVIGQSILQPALIEKILVHSRKTDLFFASGSTKDVEFKQLTQFLSEMYQTQQYQIEGYRPEIRVSRLIDAQTGIEQGGKIEVQLCKARETIVRNFYLLGDLTPINFLYYGVPTEMMDRIISQLGRASLGLVNVYRQKKLPKSALYAVDQQINEWGQPI